MNRETGKNFLNTRTIKKHITAGKVLDLGCGKGRICIFFAQNGFESYGIDFASRAIDRAKKFSKEAKTSDNFDVAVDSSVFDHAEPKNRNLYLKNFLRILKQKGFYI